MTSNDYDALLNDSKGIPFWLDLPCDEHSKLRDDCRTVRGNSICYFWDLIGKPVKNGEEKTQFDYQHTVLNVIKCSEMQCQSRGKKTGHLQLDRVSMKLICDHCLQQIEKQK